LPHEKIYPNGWIIFSFLFGKKEERNEVNDERKEGRYKGSGGSIPEIWKSEQEGFVKQFYGGDDLQPALCGMVAQMPRTEDFSEPRGCALWGFA